MRRYANVVRDLEAAGLMFRPLAFSAEGRPHPTVVRVMAHVAKQVARRRPGAESSAILQRWRREVGTAIARRIARMMKSCLPHEKGRISHIVLGST
eukprot:156097-Karenia_brevis.AAC.1